MSNELIAIISIGIALAGLQLHNHHYQRADMQSLRTDMQTLRTDMQAEFKAVRAEMQAEFKAVRTEMRTEFEAVRAEMHTEITTLREETQAEFKVQREAINDLLSRMTRLEALFEDRRVATGKPGPG